MKITIILYTALNEQFNITKSMNVLNYIIDSLSKHQKKLEVFAILLLFLTVSFQFENFKTIWFWNGKIHIAISIVLILISIALIWVKIERKNASNKIEQIKLKTHINNKTSENPLTELSARQGQIFELIIQGKSNKEIMSTLCIELSTLKTHINSIYKILDIKSRKEVNKFKSTENNIP